MDLDQKKAIFLKNFLDDSCFVGWNYKTFDQASLLSFNDAKYAYCLFPNDLEDLVSYFSEFINKTALQYIDQKELLKSGVTKRIFLLLVARLNALSPYKEPVKSLYNKNIYPKFLFLASKNIWKIVNDFWYIAGDKSTDYNFYTKRLLLLNIYKDVILFWFNDHSKDMQPTKDFIIEKLDSTKQFGKLKTTIKNKIIKKIPFIRLLIIDEI